MDFLTATYSADLVVGTNDEVCPYPWHLGTDTSVMRSCVEEIYSKYKLIPAKIREVRIKRGNKNEFIYDKDGWRTA